MPDFDAIAAAVAARYAPAQVTPPVGLTNIRRSTADLPQALNAMPAFLVFPDAGSLAAANGTRIGVATFLGRFYFGLARNLPRETNALRKWASVLVDQHAIGIKLGLPAVVTTTRTIAWRMGQLTYGGKDYSGLELTIEVVTSEPWTPTA